MASLDDGILAFENATGLTPVRGGKHPSGGTENALVSLGDGAYLEIVAPRSDAAASEGFVSYLRTLKTPFVIGWMLRVLQADAARARVQELGFNVSELRPGSRVTPTGETLQWVTFGVESAQIATAPFFIEWSASARHPASSSPGGCTIRRFELADPKANELSRLLAGLNVEIPVRAADQPHMQLALRCADREASFTSQ